MNNILIYTEQVNNRKYEVKTGQVVTVLQFTVEGQKNPKHNKNL